jgi:hypothetical protein
VKRLARGNRLTTRLRLQQRFHPLCSIFLVQIQTGLHKPTPTRYTNRFEFGIAASPKEMLTKSDWFAIIARVSKKHELLAGVAQW